MNTIGMKSLSRSTARSETGATSFLIHVFGRLEQVQIKFLCKYSQTRLHTRELITHGR